MRLAYAEPETPISADSCFNEQEQEAFEVYIKKLEGRIKKQKNPYPSKDLKRYVWVLARLGGWKAMKAIKIPGITTLWIGMRRFTDSMAAYLLLKDVSTR